MKLPTQKKILREDLKDAPNWISGVIDPINNFMETVYQTLNKNVTEENTASQIKELTYKTPSTYPTMDNVEFISGLKTKARGVAAMQVYDKDTYTPAAGPVYVPWIEDNGTIIIYPITGLQASKTYIVRLRIT